MPPYLRAAEQPPSDSTLDALAQRYRAPLISFFRRRLRNEAEAEDLAHEVFMRVIRRGDGGAPAIENAQAFLFETAANLLRDHIRKQNIRRTYADEAPVRSPQVETITPERILVSKEMLRRLRHAFQGLEERTQDIFVLFHIENMKQHDIAAFLDVSHSTVQKHVVKALAHLAASVDQT